MDYINHLTNPHNCPKSMSFQLNSLLSGLPDTVDSTIPNVIPNIMPNPASDPEGVEVEWSPTPTAPLTSTAPSGNAPSW